MNKKSIITTKNMTIDFVDNLITNAEKIRNSKGNEFSNFLQNKIIFSLFLEPSTRTYASFAAATHKLGGKLISVNDPQYSSLVKGESYEDMIKTIECYSDMIILRSPTKGMAEVASKIVEIPVINAGDGDGEHPTQALLDIYTIYREKGRLENINLGLVGDLKYSRTIHSLCYFAKIYNMNVYCISPKDISLPEYYENTCNIVAKTEKIEEVVRELDVIYVTRIQKERMPGLQNNFKTDLYKITPEIMSNARKDCIVMHPFPRNDEICTSFDNDKRAVYFRQIENGMWIRCSILKYCFS